MSTIEDFKGAPIGTTATHTDGSRAMKMDRPERNWSTPEGVYLDDVEMKLRGYTLDLPAPTTVHDTLDLAWELAHEVKEGQHIPRGVRLLDRLDRNDFSVYTTQVGFTINTQEALSIRILDPLPDPEPKPDWLDAPAVLAVHDSCTKPSIWGKHWDQDWLPEYYQSAVTAGSAHWAELRDVIPLYPKGQET